MEMPHLIYKVKRVHIPWFEALLKYFIGKFRFTVFIPMKLRFSFNKGSFDLITALISFQYEFDFRLS